MDFIEHNNKQDVLTHLWLQYRGCFGTFGVLVALYGGGSSLTIVLFANVKKTKKTTFNIFSLACYI